MRSWLVTLLAVAIAAVAVIFAGARLLSAPTRPPAVHARLPASPASYLGVYEGGAPPSPASIAGFAAAVGHHQPNLAGYFSGWAERFQTSYALEVRRRGMIPFVQIDPSFASVAGIASGAYDGYLRAYADSVRGYGYGVVIGFGHEMNAPWYSWGYGHTPPATFVAAWRHIVTLFRARGARNVTWLWTVNIIDDPHYGKIPSPARWWPGRQYVTWIGIDGYYYHPSTSFSSLFGPTIAAVRQITGAPILIAETAAVPAAGQPAKIADLFAGVRLYGLLGFVWFDVTHPENWRLSSPEALAAFRRGARNYRRPAPGSS